MRYLPPTKYFPSETSYPYEWTFLSILTVFSALLHLIFHFVEPTLSRDAITYLEIVRRWIEEGRYLRVPGREYFVPPFYLSLIRILAFTGIPLETAGLLLNGIFGAFLVPISYFFCLEIDRDRRIAFLAACFMAVHPVITDLTNDCLRENSYLFFSGLFLIFLFRYFRKSGQSPSHFRFSRYDCFMPVSLGLLLACAILSRMEALEYVVLIFILSLVSLFRKSDLSRNLLLRSGGILLSAVLFSFLLFLALGMSFREIFDSAAFYFDRLFKHLLFL